jgi:hypothetical protein
VIIPDHTPQMECAASWHAGMAYALGWMRAALRFIGGRAGGIGSVTPRIGRRPRSEAHSSAAALPKAPGVSRVPGRYSFPSGLLDR